MKTPVKFLRIFLPAAAALALIFALFAPSASAQGDYPPTGGPTFSDPNPVPGTSTTVTGCGLDPGTTVDVTLGSQTLGSGTAGDDGCYSVTVTIPANTADGTYTLAAVAGGVTLTSTTITVGGSGGGGGAGGGALPTTGSNTIPMVQIALGLLALGGLLVVVSRRKTNDTPMAA